jgi:hypothetical protein
MATTNSLTSEALALVNTFASASEEHVEEVIKVLNFAAQAKAHGGESCSLRDEGRSTADLHEDHQEAACREAKAITSRSR